MTAKEKHPALEVAKKRAEAAGDGVVTLSTGVRARLVPVSINLVRDAAMRVPDPEVPKFLNEEKGREEENPNDPAYLKAVAEAAEKRATAGMDAAILFGVELADGLPENDGWLRKLKFMERRGQIDLSEFDLDDPFDREFLYKKYVAVAASDMDRVSELSGFGRGEVDAALASFPGDEERGPD